jgi:hypothetical protein
MTDDLVKRLRIGIHTSADEQVLRDEAADRIEHLENRCANLLIGTRALNIRSDKLEAALRVIVGIHPFKDPEGDVSIKSLVDLVFSINMTARKALDDAP